ncbi:MAG: DUF2958 domain-containing protein [Chloroflexota bacterium]|nr:DUF2958 domain-containing protein [Chloroflexota bacterium]
MSWHSKETRLPFDQTPMEGFQYLHGDLMAQRYKQERLRGQKYPIIHFLSQLDRELTQAEDRGAEPLIHIFGAMHLSRHASRDEAFTQAMKVVDDYPAYFIRKLNDDTLIVANSLAKRAYGIQFDNQARQIINVQRGWSSDVMMDLLPGEIRAALPLLYATEKLGKEVIAVVKYFTPDANWTWYATEFDGIDTFFGLVKGLDTELGYFSLSELESVRGSFGLPVERDLYFEPTSISALRRTAH